jgi:protein TonB
MKTPALQPVYRPHDPSRRILAIGLVIALHVLLAWGILSGTARQTLQYVKSPLQAVLIQEVIIPPPPPAPPQRIEPPKPKPKPKPKPPPPPAPFIPPPETATAPISAAPVVQATPAPAPQAPVIQAPAPLPAPVAIAAPVPAPAPPPAKPAGPTITSAGLACPKQVAPVMPRAAIRENMSGVVKAQARIKDGKVLEVTILSGPRVFHRAVREAMAQYGCTQTDAEVLATQVFQFKLE